jgi:hypothetical protein
MGPDRPLTVHKRRKGRGSIFGSSIEEGPLEEMSFSMAPCLIRHETLLAGPTANFHSQSSVRIG